MTRAWEIWDTGLFLDGRRRGMGHEGLQFHKTGCCDWRRQLFLHLHFRFSGKGGAVRGRELIALHSVHINCELVLSIIWIVRRRYLGLDLDRPRPMSQVRYPPSDPIFNQSHPKVPSFPFPPPLFGRSARQEGRHITHARNCKNPTHPCSLELAMGRSVPRLG